MKTESIKAYNARQIDEIEKIKHEKCGICRTNVAQVFLIEKRRVNLLCRECLAIEAVTRKLRKSFR